MDNTNSSDSNKKVIKKIVYKVPVRLASPICVSMGAENSELTDNDVIRSYDGTPFIPGSSIAGALRAYIAQEKDKPGIFGYAKPSSAGAEDKGAMSSLYITDLVFDEQKDETGNEIENNAKDDDHGRIKIEIRDSVKLRKDEKIAEPGAKFDMEVVDTGATGHFYIELLVREGDSEAEMTEHVEHILQAIHGGEIRFGSKKTRGYGRMEIGFALRNEESSETNMSSEDAKAEKDAEEVFVAYYKKQEFSRDNIEDYKNVYAKFAKEKSKCYANDFKKKNTNFVGIVKSLPSNPQYTTITVPLRLTGGISIRKYAAEKGKPDYEHITAGGQPVIPGTSMAGAFRHRIREILQKIEPEKAENIEREMFGYVDVKMKENEEGKEKSKVNGSRQEEEAASKISPIVFEECVIENVNRLVVVRNAISRFEGATKNGALYQELTYVPTTKEGGKTTLTIKVRKDKDGRDAEWIKYLLLAVYDLINGYLAIGGLTAVGRGIFEGRGKAQIDGEDVGSNMAKKYGVILDKKEGEK